MANLNAPLHEFEAGGHIYRARRLDAMTQWGIVRKLSPLAASMTSLAAAMSAGIESEGAADEEVEKNARLSDKLFRALRKDGADSALKIAAKTLAEMSDQDSDYILNHCLRAVERKAPNGGWLPVWNPQADKVQYADIEMPHMLKIAMEVLKDSLGGFFPELLSVLSAPQPQ